MTITQAVLGFAAVAALLTIIPGIDTTLVLRTTLVRGPGHGFAATLGIVTGCLVWGVAAAVGAAALLAASEVAFKLLTIAGALYMVYLGLSMLIKSFKRHETDAATIELAPSDAPLWRSFAIGFATNLLNPKIGVFYIATIPLFIPAGVSPLLMGLLLAGVHALFGIVWLGSITLGASAARRWIANDRALRIIDRVAGTVLVGFGAKLAWDAGT